MARLKYPTPLTRIARFNNTKEIALTVYDTCAWMSFDQARELRDYIDEMLEGNLVEVRQRDCGCLEKITDSKKGKTGGRKQAR